MGVETYFRSCFEKSDLQVLNWWCTYGLYYSLLKFPIEDLQNLLKNEFQTLFSFFLFST